MTLFYKDAKLISFSKQVWTFSPKIGVITSFMKSSELIIDFRLKSRVESSAEVFCQIFNF